MLKYVAALSSNNLDNNLSAICSIFFLLLQVHHWLQTPQMPSSGHLLTYLFIYLLHKAKCVKYILLQMLMFA